MTASSSTTPKMPAISRKVLRTKHGAAHAVAHADVLDGHDHLRQQIEEVDERDPDDQDARGDSRRIVQPRSTLARDEVVAADDEGEIERRGRP